MRRFIRRCLSLFTRNSAEDDLAREMTAHLTLLEAEYQRRGMSPDEARLAARRAMGSVALAKDLHRDARSFGWLEDLRRDLRHAVRHLRRSPGFTLTAVLALGLGIGVNTAFFTILNAICLRGLPIDSAERVMWLSTRNAQDRPGNMSYAEFDELRARTTTFEQIAAYTNTVVAVGDNRQPPARVLGAFISAGAFELIGVRPVVGRTFRPDEDRPGGSAVVILGAEIWSSRYGSDPAIVGQSITVNGVPSTVVGVMPRGFMFPANADLWRPMANLAAAVRESRVERRLAVFARLRDGATEDQARSDMAAISAAWAREFSATNRDIQLTPFQSTKRSTRIGRIPVGCLSSLRARWCCSLPAPTSPTSSSCVPRLAGGRSRFARRSGRHAAVSCVNCWSRARLWRGWRVRSASSWRGPP